MAESSGWLPSDANNKPIDAPYSAVFEGLEYKADGVTALACVSPLTLNFQVATTLRARTSNVATLTFVSTSGFVVGQWVRIASLGGTGYNGLACITGVTSTTITYANTGDNEVETADTAGRVTRQLRITAPTGAATLIFRSSNTLKWGNNTSLDGTATGKGYRTADANTDYVMPLFGANTAYLEPTTASCTCEFLIELLKTN